MANERRQFLAEFPAVKSELEERQEAGRKAREQQKQRDDNQRDIESGAIKKFMFENGGFQKRNMNKY